jgi:hypothetical protein
MCGESVSVEPVEGGALDRAVSRCSVSDRKTTSIVTERNDLRG